MHDGSWDPPAGGSGGSNATPHVPPTDDLERERVRLAAQARLFGRPAELRVGRYLLDAPMGEGATGIVYRAHDDQLHRHVALKVLNASVAQTPQHRERLMREARAMAQLSHPNVAVVHEVGVHHDRLFIAMELLGGGTLRHWLEREQRSWREVLSILVAAGRGLEAAHRQGLVHRDFKPDNVLVGDDGRARIVDFGLVRPPEGEAQAPHLSNDQAPVTSMTLTSTGAMLGTPAYMAPELFLGGAADAKSDQFAFCVTAYELLYGARPFRAETLVQHVAAVVNGQVVPPPSSYVPVRVSRAIMRGLARDPALRHASMTELLRVFESELSRRRIGVLAAAVLLTVVLVALWIGVFRWERTELEARAKAAALEQKAAVEALLDDGEYDECIDYTLTEPASEELFSAGSACALRKQDYRALADICKRWRKIAEAPAELCDPIKNELWALLAEKRYEECWKLAKKQPDTALYLGLELDCAQNAGDPEAFARACKRLNEKHPDDPNAKLCPLLRVGPRPIASP